MFSPEADKPWYPLQRNSLVPSPWRSAGEAAMNTSTPRQGTSPNRGNGAKWIKHGQVDKAGQVGNAGRVDRRGPTATHHPVDGPGCSAFFGAQRTRAHQNHLIILRRARTQAPIAQYSSANSPEGQSCSVQSREAPCENREESCEKIGV